MLNEFIRKVCKCLCPDKAPRYKIKKSELNKILEIAPINDKEYIEAYYYDTYDVIR